ncbi:SGNH/GDSL hydrolase family protein [Mycetocola tolaasinivorans]|uniref:SGNH/GDSL hydrolase family protein n=1 Tax=Mycetocola tolaasinivorans TaxID=76635 RepID=A0A3L7A2P3_9MICO|nr:SGNH/GDSL hydrolase family protein [Mycetocola tolaasinivorans]RLP74265.1 SGNH/GDSL hydrolase family protein [Mycetocola tolaasinivorans]
MLSDSSSSQGPKTSRRGAEKEHRRASDAGGRGGGAVPGNRRHRARFALLAGAIPVALIALLAIPGDDGVLGAVGADARGIELSVAGAFHAKAAPGGVSNSAVYIIGDSYSRDSGASDPQHDNMHLVAAHFGWPVDNLAVGGVGYGVSIEGSNSQGECGQTRCPSYLEQIAQIPATATRILVNGGKNEVNVDEADSDAHIDTFYAMLRAAHPTADIVATSPLWQQEDEPDSMAHMRARVEADVEAIGGKYLDLGQPLVSEPDLISDDGEHPNDDGQAVLAGAIVNAFTKLGDREWTTAKGIQPVPAPTQP